MSIGADVMKISWLKLIFPPFFGENASFGFFFNFLVFWVHLDPLGDGWTKTGLRVIFLGLSKNRFVFVLEMMRQQFFFFPEKAEIVFFSQKEILGLVEYSTAVEYSTKPSEWQW